jgi:hypothetical protein
MMNGIGSKWLERLHSPVTLYVAGAAVLTMIPLILASWYIVDRTFGMSAGESVLSGKRAQVASLGAQLTPLRGMAGEISATRTAIDSFYANRVPTSYSQLTGSVGEVATMSGVRLSQVTYEQGAPGSDLVEVSMDAGVNGNYRQVMRFVNGLERDRLFYVIRAVSFAGQQGGSVNLRVRMSTWMKPGDAMRYPVESTAANAAALVVQQAGPQPGVR